MWMYTYVNGDQKNNNLEPSVVAVLRHHRPCLLRSVHSALHVTPLTRRGTFPYAATRRVGASQPQLVKGSTRSMASDDEAAAIEEVLVPPTASVCLVY